jgi:hypothetical protein
VYTLWWHPQIRRYAGYQGSNRPASVSLESLRGQTHSIEDGSGIIQDKRSTRVRCWEGFEVIDECSVEEEDVCGKIGDDLGTKRLDQGCP